MTGKQIASRLGFHGRTSRYQGNVCWMVKCPAHDDKRPSLSITERDGWVRFSCFRGCTRDEILSALGLKVRDLALNEFHRNPEWEKRRREEERLELLQRQNALAIMAKVVNPEERNYWSAVDRNTAKRVMDLRDKLYPEEKMRRDKEAEVQRVISEYGYEELWECLPEGIYEIKRDTA